jgi:hypothetical protein
LKILELLNIPTSCQESIDDLQAQLRSKQIELSRVILERNDLQRDYSDLKGNFVTPMEIPHGWSGVKHNGTYQGLGADPTTKTVIDSKRQI